MAGVCGSGSPLALCELAGTARASLVRVAGGELLARPLLVLLAAAVQMLFCMLFKARTPRYDPAKGRLEYVVFFWVHTLAVDVVVGAHTLLAGAARGAWDVRWVLLVAGYTVLGAAQVWLCGAGVLDGLVAAHRTLRRRTRTRLAVLCGAACAACVVLALTAARAPRHFPAVAVGVVAAGCFGYALTQAALLARRPSVLGWGCFAATLAAHVAALVLACRGRMRSRWVSEAELALTALGVGHLVHFATFPLYNGSTSLVHVLDARTTLKLGELARHGG